MRHVLILLGLLAAADSAMALVSNTEGSLNSTEAQDRVVSGTIHLARTTGSTGSSAQGGPACSQLQVGIYLQSVNALNSRALGSVRALDLAGSTDCAYQFSNTSPNANPNKPRRWFMIVNERGPISYGSVCYQHGYADLGLFTAQIAQSKDINLSESCP